MKRILTALAAVAFAAPVYAGTGTLTLNTTVNAVCQFDVAAMTENLPNYDATAGIANHVIPVDYTCTPGLLPPTLTIVQGDNDTGPGAHQLSDGTNFIPYTATVPAAAPAPNGASQSTNIRVDVPAGTFVPAGAYTDTLDLTIQF